ncbi:pyridine nucleotide-disulfide oxidoreductase [Sulfurifustis variabilis]|uniref:Pyridine nucleotide-disulfide oxidoreductase n=1 Tax=Sulfurifustis variabilis TaxID=1675686 RepID=A0A1B4V2W3_9GAMM|nr:FAD-dependent oxidoreductase [Sulfurifustis variabilis]BAU46802.1 pyridine nucleotide-disulfide oxidoreductase [Sulfurifustis variabilis]
MSKAELKLANGFTFTQLQEIETLRKLDREFLARVRAQDAALHERLLRYRQSEQALGPIERSELLLALGPLLERMVVELFGVEDAVATLRAATLGHDPIFAFKKNVVLKRARRRLLKKDEFEPFAELDRWLTGALAAAKLDSPDRELATARYGLALLRDEKANADALEKLTRWCVRAMTSDEGGRATAGWVSLKLPHGIEHDHLVPFEPLPDDPAGRVEGPAGHMRRRDGFKLTDPRMSGREVQHQVNYCIYCHDHDGDFCSKGFPEKKGEPERGLKVNPLGVTLTGCPLEEKISEMHVMKRDGLGIAALAMITIDNPMCAATGHRICNDCMKACVYQKQDPVDIPQSETGILTDVLALPWGVEIYDLLIRWNPLRPRQWLPKPYNGLKALIIGMGPAGFTLAHHLLMEGFAVVGTEGLKIEPLPEEYVRLPVRNYGDLKEELDERVMAGFGGVAEYGITNRWDKNFLKLIYLSLSRRPYFQVYGGVRFGGTVTVEDAWAMGFDHVAIAVGAGLPQALPIPGSLAPGMRQANDFLMALQLTGAAKRASLANLQVRLPAVVIGGGLTGIDTATEAQAYYIAQVEKTLDRYDTLVAARGETVVRGRLDEESRLILDEFLEHGRAVRAERARAKAAGEAPDFLPLLKQWGGVTVAYRRGMTESPAYTRNHEEIVKAFEEGVMYAEGLAPVRAELDRFGHVAALVCQRQAKADTGAWRPTEEEVRLPARSIFVATGARPNVAYEFEHKGHFAKERGHYQTFEAKDDANVAVPVASHAKLPEFGPFTSYVHDGRRVSFVGDTHPVFHGSVVKAIASGKRIYPKIVETFGSRADAVGDDEEYDAFRAHIDAAFAVKVKRLRRLAKDVVELTVHAPQAALKFKPGQFFRLQNYETHSPFVDGTRLQTEALALSGAHVDPKAGDVSLIVVEQGASSRLISTLKPGDPVALMGPAGVRAKIPSAETVMIVGDRLGVAHLLATGPALRAAGNRVLYVGHFKTADQVFLREEIEQAADVVVWSVEEGPPVKPSRPDDHYSVGSAIEAIQRYADGALGPSPKRPPIPVEEVDRLMIVGSNRLVRAVRDAKHGLLAPRFCKAEHTVASVSTPMQCMLKGVCSQCLQWQIDPKTGHRTKAVFGCSWQDQPLDIVDLDNLDERLGQNRLQERLTDLWLEHLLDRNAVPRV